MEIPEPGGLLYSRVELCLKEKIGHSASCAKLFKDPKSKNFLLNVAH